MTAQTFYTIAGVGLMATGFFAWMVRRHLIRRLMGVNLISTGLFMVLIAGARQAPEGPDPVPQAMVLTGIVVAVSATALGLALIQHIYEERGARSLGEGGAGE
ncbi:Na+/H+ antiporter subunit C [Lujinxingia litoralis]|uniref:Na+/H+ antiporter subunit C n=1 Tax=Lujinxingia litoralis TaxID=2211119 RepID=A0A328CAU3_9DELT|nr:NADH-quinone oxidoreductase subunit K [Lujinxingia litoralis]RAL25292.1 Na+/H+ antiporter subunit C [Lujinxingia litoralis]